MTTETSEALNRLAREQTKLKLLADIHTDMVVCEIEDWDHRAYLRDLHDLIAHHDPCATIRALDGTDE